MGDSGPARRTLRSQLVLLVLAALIPMLAFATAFIVWSARQQRATVERGAIEIARALVTAVEREIVGAIAALEVLADAEFFDRDDLPGLHGRLRRALGGQPDWLTIHVSAPDGRMLLDAVRPLGEPLTSVVEPRSLDRVVKSRRPDVGDVVFRPVVQQHSIAIRVPVMRDRAVRYVLTAIVAARTFRDILTSQRLPADWIVSVLDAQRVHVARTRALERFVAQRGSDDLVDALARMREGWMPGRTLDNEPVYAAFSTSSQFGWAVAIGIPAAAVDAPLRRSLIGLAAWAVAAALGAMLIAILVGRRLAAPLAELAATAPAIVAGEEPMRSRPSSIAEIEALATSLEHAARERARAEAELHRTSRLLTAVFEGTTDAVFVKDLDGRYVTINEAGAGLLGRTAAEVIGNDDTALFAPESAKRITAQDRQVIETGETQTFENTDLESATGAVRTFLSTKGPYRDLNGRIIGVLGITRDISARRRAEEDRARALEREQAARAEAEVANRAKDEFLAVLSHELRTPLNAVYGWARMLRGGALDADTRKRAVEVIERNATAQLQLIEDLLDISRIITGKMRLDVRPIDLVAVVSSAIDSMRPAADAKNIRLQTSLDPRAAPMVGDPDRLQQVVWNLVANAVKFTPRDGRVDVSVRRVNAHVEIAVTDTGQGIAPETLPYVFDRFRQGDSSSTRQHGGLGLGLALVRHLAELHGGTVSAHSEGVDRGATFVVSLPLSMVLGGAAAELPHVTPVNAVARASSLSGVRVLVVDDDAEALELVATILREARADVATAVSADEAIALVRDWRPGVLLSDIEMPGEDGYMLLRRIQALERETGTRVAAVALTAYGRIEDRLRTLAAGFSLHLPKPVDPAELVAVVGALARRR